MEKVLGVFFGAFPFPCKGSAPNHITTSPQGKPLAVSMNYDLSNPDSNKWYYYHYNAHGDVVAVTDANGNVFREYVYDPYGNIISVKKENGVEVIDLKTDDFNHAYTYAGYRFDMETGLYYLNTRYYEAGIGRFLTKDSVIGAKNRPQTLNRYAYCGGDPVNRIDPYGDSFTDWIGKISSNAFKNLIDFWFGSPTPIAYDYGSDGMDIPGGLVAASVSHDTPPPKSSGYRPPKTKGPLEPTKAPNGQVGWPDKSGNVWVPVPTGHPNAHGGEHWDVQYPNGGYDNVYPNGVVRKGKGPRGKFSPSGARFSSVDLGLTGGALVAYWIVSEGTRVIPIDGRSHYHNNS